MIWSPLLQTILTSAKKHRNIEVTEKQTNTNVCTHKGTGNTYTHRQRQTNTHTHSQREAGKDKYTHICIHTV